LQSPAQRLKSPDRAATPLAVLLIERIREAGPLTFAEYMDACLYHPRYGYYTKAHQQPKRDYVTNVDVSPLFGRLLARQLGEMWAALGRPDPFWLVEAGAGNGELAGAILNFAAQALPGFYAAVRYRAVERSDARLAAQSSLLDEHIRRDRFAAVPHLPKRIPEGCIFSNELLDALPVHRLVQEKDRLQELYVGVRHGRLVEQTGGLSSPRIADFFARQGIGLREGQQAEAGLAACDWIRDAGERLRRGFVLTIDYGREAGELYDRLHMRGTLLAYERHHANEDFFRAPGDQDLTAHANFTALDLWGSEGGLVRTGLTTQSKFLLGLARASKFADIDPQGAMEEEQSRRRLAFTTLIHPEGMGEAFQVFVQHKGFSVPPALTALKLL
jgi:SAM-dependent MidA family methyltransferase